MTIKCQNCDWNGDVQDVEQRVIPQGRREYRCPTCGSTELAGFIQT